MPIWTNTFLQQLESDAIGNIAADCHCIWARECVSVTQGVSKIPLPSYVRRLMGVIWRGRHLDPVSWEELTMLSPATVFVNVNSPNSNIETSQSRPLYYAMHPTDPYDIRLYPTPDESFTTAGEPNPYSPQVNTPSCIIEYYRAADETQTQPLAQLPPYVFRRTMKAFVLWKAFAAEGKGQNLKAAA